MNQTSDYILGFITQCYENNTIEHILKIAYKYLENPIALYDGSYKVLAYEGTADKKDRIFSETIKGGYLPEEVISYFMNQGLLSEDFRLLYAPFSPMIHQADDFASKRIGVAVPSSKNLINGWLAVFKTKRDFNETDIELVSWLSKILSPLLEQIHNEHDSLSSRIGNILTDYLNGITDMYNLEAYGYKQPKEVRLLTIRADHEDIPKPVQEVIFSFFENKRNIIFSYHNQLLALIDADKSDELINDMKQTIRRLDLYMSISHPFSDAADIKHYYQQNLDCLQIGSIEDPEKRIYSFEEYSGPLLLRTAGKFFNIDEYEHPVLEKILEYDKVNHTDYFLTLEQYVKCNCNMKRAAYVLDIHRNTLSYRITAIAKLFDIDIFNQEFISKLHLGFAIHDCVVQSKKDKM